MSNRDNEKSKMQRVRDILPNLKSLPFFGYAEIQMEVAKANGGNEIGQNALRQIAWRLVNEKVLIRVKDKDGTFSLIDGNQETGTLDYKAFYDWRTTHIKRKIKRFLKANPASQKYKIFGGINYIRLGFGIQTLNKEFDKMVSSGEIIMHEGKYYPDRDDVPFVANYEI